MVAELEAMVGEEPLREERWRVLALALYRANRQGDALNALRRARQTFADELGIDPGPALRGLEADILAQSPALSASVPTPPPLSPAPAAVSATTPATPDDDGTDLIDRTRELARIRQAIADLHGGRSTRAGTPRDRRRIAHASGCALVGGDA